jgi:hypothetical protein
MIVSRKRPKGDGRNETVAENLYADPIEVRHEDLEPLGIERNQFARRCPVCKEGALLGRRDKSHALSEEDYCVLCGQRVIYTSLGGHR